MTVAAQVTPGGSFHWLGRLAMVALPGIMGMLPGMLQATCGKDALDKTAGQITAAELAQRIDERIALVLAHHQAGPAPLPPPCNDLERLIDARLDLARQRFEGLQVQQAPAQPSLQGDDDHSIAARLQRAMANLDVPVAARRGRWYGNAVSLGALFPNFDFHSHSLDAFINLHDAPVLGDRSFMLPSAAAELHSPSAAPIAVFSWYPRGNRHLSIDAGVGLPLFEVSLTGMDFPLSMVGELVTLRLLPMGAVVSYHFLPQRMINPYIGAGPIWMYTYDERMEARGWFGDNTKPDKTRLNISSPWLAVFAMGTEINLTDRFFFRADLQWIPRLHLHIKVREFNLLGTGVHGNMRLRHIKADGTIFTMSTGLRF